MYYFKSGNEKKVITVEGVINWLKSQIESTKNFSELFSSYDKRKDVMDAKNSVMEQTITRIEKEKENLKTTEDVINMLQKDVDDLANTDTLGIYQLDQMIRGKKIFLESILEKIKEL